MDTRNMEELGMLPINNQVENTGRSLPEEPQSSYNFLFLPGSNNNVAKPGDSIAADGEETVICFHSDQSGEDYYVMGLRGYRSVILDHCLDPVRDVKILTTFLGTFGNWLQHLEVSFLFEELVTFQGVLLSRFTPNLVNIIAKVSLADIVAVDKNSWNFDIEKHDCLRTLALQGETDNPINLPTEGWIQLLKRYPKIKLLHLGIDKYISKSDATDFSTGMTNIINKINPAAEAFKTLKKMRIRCDCEPPTSLLRLFSTSKLRLEELDITVSDNVRPYSIQRPLKGQANFLKHLTLGAKLLVLPGSTPPLMPLVERLELIGFPMCRLSFLNGFCNLATLVIRHCDQVEESTISRCPRVPVLANILEHDMRNMSTILSLTTFHSLSESWVGKFDSADIGKLKIIMPNLKNLKMWLTKDSMQAVCRSWPTLQSLHVIGNEIDDFSITGIIGGGCGHYTKLTTNCVADLKSLKTFKMSPVCSDGERMVSNITEISLTHGCMMLPNLEILELYMSAIPTSETIRLLQEKIPNSTLWYYDQ